MERANAFVEVTEWSSNLLVFLKGLKSFLNDFDNWWKQPFTDYNNMITMAQDDLHVKKNPVSLSDFSLEGQFGLITWTFLMYGRQLSTSDLP